MISKRSLIFYNTVREASLEKTPNCRIDQIKAKLPLHSCKVDLSIQLQQAWLSSEVGSLSVGGSMSAAKQLHREVSVLSEQVPVCQ